MCLTDHAGCGLLSHASGALPARPAARRPRDELWLGISRAEVGLFQGARRAYIQRASPRESGGRRHLADVNPGPQVRVVESSGMPRRAYVSASIGDTCITTARPADRGSGYRL
jgi:hypothetical protein